MSTRACIIIHKPGVYTPKGAQLVKLYNHCDGYISGLGVNLVRGFRSYKRERDIKECIRKADYFHRNKFEITPYIHGDTEYLYHVYFSKNNGQLKITVQGLGSQYCGDDYLIREKEDVLYTRYISKGCMKYPEAYGEKINEDILSLKEIKDRERYNVYQLMEDRDLVLGVMRFELDIEKLKRIIEWYGPRYEKLSKIEDKDLRDEEENKLLDEILEEINIEVQEGKEKGGR